ncbi:MAG: PAS domain S-box protein, partial [Gammaproteobacteria bacterium]|nr:PAS domain S-box protein [Gammaproteobacteria bacterium]
MSQATAAEAILNSHLHNLLRAVGSCMLIVDAELRLELFSPGGGQLFGLGPEAIGQDLRRFPPQLADPLLIADLELVLRSQAQLSRLVLGEKLRGENQRSRLRSCSPYLDPPDGKARVLISYLDTSQISRSHQALKESEARFELILQTTPNAILVLDDKHSVVIANRRAEQLFGASGGGLLGTPIERLISQHPSTAAVDWAALSQSSMAQAAANQPGEPKPALFNLHRLDSGRLLSELELSQLQLQGRRYLVMVISDVTERQQIDEAREQALSEARQLAQTRRNFLANMSHEIRTPLNGILGLAQIGLMPAYARDYAKLNTCLSQINDSGKHLLQVINNVLDFSKIDAGQMSLVQEAVDLRLLLRGCIGTIEPLAQAKGLRLEQDLSGLGPQPCLSDGLRLRQILINLLSNAVKFTEQGWVRLSARQHGERLLVEVSDSGLGIEASKLDRVFKPFEQADSSQNRRFEGTGLGLTISAHLASLLGGSLEAKSKPGEGSQFSLSLPCPPQSQFQFQFQAGAETKSRPELANLDLIGVRILVAEDEPINQMVIQEFLEQVGGQVVLFNNGRQLVEHLRAHPEEDARLILMDVE